MHAIATHQNRSIFQAIVISSTRNCLPLIFGGILNELMTLMNDTGKVGGFNLIC